METASWIARGMDVPQIVWILAAFTLTTLVAIRQWRVDRGE